MGQHAHFLCARDRVQPPLIIDYVNGIGNCSREQQNIRIHVRVCALRVMVCILGQTRCYDNLSKKWPKMATAVHLSTNSSEITVVSNLNEAYSSDGVPTLASKVELLKSLWSTLQSHKVQEAKMADFWPFSRPAHSQKTAHQVSKRSQVRQRIPRWCKGQSHCTDILK